MAVGQLEGILARRTASATAPPIVAPQPPPAAPNVAPGGHIRPEAKSGLLDARKAGKALGRLGDHLVALAERQARQRGRSRDVVVKDARRDRDDPAPQQ
jgi:hypothetical protein